MISKLDRNDHISFYTFNSKIQTIFEDLKIKDNPDKIEKLISKKQIKAEGQTAFYAALVEAIKNPADNLWIVALTDGKDNVSHQLKVTPRVVKDKYIQMQAKCNFIMITVGELENQKVIDDFCELAKSHGKVGLSIKANQSAEAIAESYKMAGDEILRGNVEMQDFDVKIVDN